MDSDKFKQQAKALIRLRMPLLVTHTTLLEILCRGTICFLSEGEFTENTAAITERMCQP